MSFVSARPGAAEADATVHEGARAPGDVILTLGPLLAACVLTFATCVILGLAINFANIIVLPLLLGIGVAFHIYFVMAWREGGHDFLQSSLSRAVLFSALTTATGFGTLWLSRHPGTASMGELLMISLGWTPPRTRWRGRSRGTSRSSPLGRTTAHLYPPLSPRSGLARCPLPPAR